MPSPRPAEQNGPAATTDPAREERRANPRYEATSYVRVLDAATGQVLGELVDISIDGFRLQTSAGIGLDDRGDRPLRLDLCLDGAAWEPIDVVATLRWQQANDSSGCLLAGFEFVYLSMQAVNQIDAFVQALAA